MMTSEASGCTENLKLEKQGTLEQSIQMLLSNLKINGGMDIEDINTSSLMTWTKLVDKLYLIISKYGLTDTPVPEKLKELL